MWLASSAAPAVIFTKEESDDLCFCASPNSKVPAGLSSLTLANGEKNWCIEINTIEMPNRKLIVRVCPKNAADASPVKIVATVDEYFFKIVSAYLKKNEERIPCAALLQMRKKVALECPRRISKLSGP